MAEQASEGPPIFWSLGKTRRARAPTMSPTKMVSMMPCPFVERRSRDAGGSTCRRPCTGGGHLAASPIVAVASGES
jgi:hypothetical protein